MDTDVTQGIKYAGFWRRFVGWLIDLLILILVSHWILVLISHFFTTPIPETLSFSAIFSTLWPKALILFIVDFIIFALYYSLFEASSIQATVGKYIVGIKITTIDGAKISHGKAFIRRVYCILSTVPVFIGYIAAGFSPRKQTFHDTLAKTVVVVNKPRKSFTLIGILILTLVLGILSDRFLGAGFHVSIQTPGVTYNSTGNTTTKKGNEVEPTLQNTVITALNNKESVFARNDVTEIRKYLLDSSVNDSKSAENINKSPDSELLKFAKIVNQIAPYMTEEVVRSANSTWTFNENMDLVRIKTMATFEDGQTGTVYIELRLVNGKWF